MSHEDTVKDSKAVDEIAGYWTDAIAEYKAGDKVLYILPLSTPALIIS
jgi:hypothetical protein